MNPIPVSKYHSVLEYPDDIVGVFIDIENGLRIEVRPLHANNDQVISEDVADTVNKMVKKL